MPLWLPDSLCTFSRVTDSMSKHFRFVPPNQPGIPFLVSQVRHQKEVHFGTDHVCVFSAFLFYKYDVYSMETVCGFCCLAITGLSFFEYYRRPKKKPLVITDRVKRLLGFLAVFIAVVLFCWFSFYYYEGLF